MTLSLAGYVADAQRLMPHWFGINPTEVHAPVLHLIPAKPTRVLDIGAGVGRDAAWLADQGHVVTAIEPVVALREAGVERYSDRLIHWLDDSLPDLSTLRLRNETFGLVMISAVWAHLDPAQRRIAMPHVAAQVAPGGRLILSIRDGWTPENRTVFDADPDETIDLAKAEGLSLIFRTTTDSIQQINITNNVRWHRLAFERKS
jgi:SAM-dependent methyltransferase